MNTQTITLDVTKRPAVTPVVHLGQGDKSGTTLMASMYDDGAALSLDGKAVRFCMQTPNGRGYYEVAGTVSGSTATFAIDETYAATVAGVTDVAYVEVLEGSTVVCSTNRFRVVVLPNATEGADPSGAYTNGVKEFLDEAESQLRSMLNVSEAELEDAISDAQSDVADAVDDADAATQRAIAAAEAAEGVIIDSIPTMSPTVKGGAKLGDGLSVEDDALNLGPLVKHSTGVTDGSALYGVQGEGYATQSGTPTPSNPQEIRVARGRNLLDIDSWLSSRTTYTKSGDVYTVTDGGTAWSNPLVFSSEPIDVTISGAISAVGGSNQRITLGTYVNGTFTSLADFEIGNSQRTATANALRMDWSNFGSAITLSHIQLERGSQATPYVPYDYMGLEVATKNLVLKAIAGSYITSNGTMATSDSFKMNVAKVSQGAIYTATTDDTSGLVMGFYTSEPTDTSVSYNNSRTVQENSFSFTAPISGYVAFRSSNEFNFAQLEQGSTATPYEPYHHTTTPLPLPSKGFLGALPDGTKDTYAIDSAGRVVVGNAIDEVVLNGTETWTKESESFYIAFSVMKRLTDYRRSLYATHYVALEREHDQGSNAGISGYGHAERYPGVNWLYILDSRFSDAASLQTWLASNPVTVLYPLAAPTTESLGYINLPALPEGATVTIPELDNVGVDYWISGIPEVTEYGLAMLARLQSEIDEVEQAVADLSAAVANL